VKRGGDLESKVQNTGPAEKNGKLQSTGKKSVEKESDSSLKTVCFSSAEKRAKS